MEWNRAFRRRNKLSGGGGGRPTDSPTRGFVAGQREIELREDEKRNRERDGGGAIKLRR